LRATLLGSLAAGIGIAVMAAPALAQSRIHWAPSYAAALAQARTTHKLVMADFYADWCGWCKRMDRDTYTDQKVIRLSQQFIPVRVNSDREGANAARQYGVTGLPTVLFINSSGRVEDTINGYLPPANFATELTRIAQEHQQIPVLQSRFRAHPQDVEAAGKLADLYARQRDTARAGAVLASAEQRDPHNSRGCLTRAYNDLGAAYVQQGSLDQAIPLFRKASRTGKQPLDVAFGHMSLAICYLQQHEPAQAKPELKAVLAMPNAPGRIKQAAQQMLGAIQQHGG